MIGWKTAQKPSLACRYLDHSAELFPSQTGTGLPCYFLGATLNSDSQCFCRNNLPSQVANDESLGGSLSCWLSAENEGMIPPYC